MTLKRIRSSTRSSLALIALVLCALPMSQWGCHNKKRTPTRYLISEGYKGWVKVHYQVNGTPPLLMAQGHYVVSVPPDGLVTTSSPQETGWAQDEYFYKSEGSLTPLSITASGGGGMIWGNVNQWGGEQIDGQGGPTSMFFVGTEAEYRAAIDESQNNPSHR
jgi:hypothetical protein